MAVMNEDYRQHYRTWIGFTRFIKIGLASVIILLILLAYFLL